MTYLMKDLILDVLPRVARVEMRSGVTIWSAANAVLDMIFKRLLERKSDLAATGDLSLAIAAMGYYATLPTDFIACAERPKSRDVYTDWMSGIVKSYNSVTGALVVTVSAYDGTDSISSWNIAIAPTPGSPSSVVGTSASTNTPGTGDKSFTATAGMPLSVSQAVYVFPTALPDTLIPIEHHLEPRYLDDDRDHDDYTWWEWYGLYGESWEPPAIRPQHYKIIGSTIYVRPKVIQNVTIVGKYFAFPTHLTATTDAIPYKSFFDEVFREGVVRIIQKGIEIPDTDQDFAGFIKTRVDSVLNLRISLIPQNRRLHRANWL